MLKPAMAMALLVCAASLWPAQAGAQQSPVEPDRTIIVQGNPEVDGDAARRQARGITFPTDDYADSLARFHRPVCVGLYGLRAAAAQDVIDRIYLNAEKAGVATNQEEGCAANLWVMIVDDPAATFERLADESSWMVRDLSRFERRRIREQQGPTRAWQITSARDDVGIVVASGTQVAESTSYSRISGLLPPMTPSTNMSRIRNGIRRDIELSMVIIARSALGDVDTIGLADYATMRTLGRTLVPDQDDRAYDAVLNLFDAQGRVDRLSAFDRAYLKGLYSGSPYRRASLGVGNLTKHMEEELGEQAEE
ncbi:hypothetical protein [Sphingomicrobium flavum]|uniref:hypothetical protein n=1 Tax=Sphingomicrobium flavum TaxID=1229164 RepID=UPI0021ADF651|nr:hypothetical protein [Sphingomicrobium flavum]